MRAIRVREFGGPEVLKMEEVADPTPQAGQVCIAVRAIGVNPVDTYIRAGIYGPRPFPYTPGFDAAGVVQSVGQGVSTCKPGDSVYTFSTLGTYAEKILVEAARAFAMPPQIGFPEAACVGVPGGTAWRALFQRGEAQPGQSLLIQGATGGVGTAALQLARAAGLKIAGTGGTDAGRRLIQKLGCHCVLDHHAANYMDEALAFTGGRGFDLILEMLANVNLDRDLQVLAKGGKVVVIGSRGRIEIDPRLTMAKDADIRGMILLSASNEELRVLHAGLYAAMEASVYTPLVGQAFPLVDAQAAHGAIMETHAPGNIVLIP